MKTPSGKIESIDQYIHGFPEPVQALLSELRTTIRTAAPQAIEKISYQMPTFNLYGNLVHFSDLNHQIFFYKNYSGVTSFQQELKIYKTSKGAVQFPIDQPLPLKLIKKIVEFRVMENVQKEEGRKKK
ncbi:MAG: hypothetical protein HGB11_01180 [Chlorobiales bacterium]|nr:hypothetical protein [Chlorobiales bacterium]